MGGDCFAHPKSKAGVRVRLGVDGQSTPIKLSVSATFISLKKVEIEPGRLFGFEKWLSHRPMAVKFNAVIFIIISFCRCAP